MHGAALRALLPAVLLLTAGHTRCLGQKADSENATVVEALTSFLSPLIVPKIMQDVHGLREYIRSDEFAEVRLRSGDLVAVDEIYAEALNLSWNNHYEALLISLVATMDHRRFGVDLPIVGALFWFPLTSEFEEDFEDRVRALPVRLYYDTPDGVAGDRDKLQHFFGSAFLTYVFESREATQRVGEMIEGSEEQFVVDGVFDERDLRANRHGEAFGMSLLGRNEVVPSEFLQLVTAAKDRGIPEVVWQPDQHATLCRPWGNWQESSLEEK